MRTTVSNMREYADIISEVSEFKSIAKQMRKDAIHVQYVYHGTTLLLFLLLALLFFACILLYVNHVHYGELEVKYFNLLNQIEINDK